jgi:hypothetical protein
VEQFVLELEMAHPAIAGRQKPPWPQLEYPWEDFATGLVCSPGANLELSRRVRNPKDRIVIDCFKMARALEPELSTILP